MGQKKLLKRQMKVKEFRKNTSLRTHKVRNSLKIDCDFVCKPLICYSGYNNRQNIIFEYIFIISIRLNISD